MKKLLAILFFILPFCASAQPPTLTSFTPASGPVGTLVTLTGTDLSSPTSLTIGGAEAVVVSNDGSTLVAMVMPGATTGSVSITTAGGGPVVAAGTYTVSASIAPALQQGAKLVGTGASGPAQQGTSVAVSADGNTAIVGGRTDNGVAGAAWIYTRSAGVWSQQGAKLVGTGATGTAGQGRSVAISADGNTAIVGGEDDDGGVGAAWVFTRSAGVWTQQGPKLVGTGAVGNSKQGFSVSLSADGNTALVGGSEDDANAGAVWVYTRSAGVWTQQGSKLVGTGAVGTTVLQGISVALSADGNTAMVGGHLDDGNIGAAWVYTRSAGVWSQEGPKLVGTGATGNAFQGFSVALSADGNTALVGGIRDNSLKGAAWVYTRTAGAWSQQGPKLVGTGGVGNGFQGYRVGLSADGNTALVSGPVDDGNKGAAWFYTRTAGAWTQSGSKRVGTGAVNTPLAAQQGYGAALSADGNTAIVGGNADDNNTGAAWAFFGPLPPPTLTGFTPAGGPIGTLVTLTGTELGSPTSLIIGGTEAVVVSNDGSTLVALVMPGATTGGVGITTAGGGPVTAAGTYTVTPSIPPALQQGGKLVGTGAVGAAQQGISVAMSADGSTAILGGNTDDSNAGAAWVYTRSGSTWSQQGAKLVGTSAVGTATQGSSVALSADGNTALVGGQGDDSFVGAVWVYTRSSGIWSQQGSKLVGMGAVGAARQGTSVSLSADGNTALVGGFTDNSNEGAVWVYARNAGVWSQQGSKLVGTGAVGVAQQGVSVALSADGNTALVGGISDNTNTGAVWVFTRSAGVWTQQGSKLVGTGALGNAFQGFSVALGADGNTALAGAPSDDGGTGALWVYTRSAGVWTQQGSKLVGTGAVGPAQQGNSVSLSADGNTALVGGYFDNSLLGAAWVYTRSAGVWTQQGAKRVGTAATGAANQGWSVAVSADGNHTFITGPGDNGGLGAAWAFEGSTPLPVTWQQLSATLLPDQRAEIRWTTASELNNERFELEHSTPTLLREGAWRPLGTVPGSGTTSRSSRYAFATEALTQGTHYFRLWQVDYDGTRSLSPIVSLRVGESAPDGLELYPNPVSRSQDLILQLSSDQDSDYSLELLDLTGRTVLRRNGQLAAGSNTLVLKIGELPPGTYFGRCSSTNKILTGHVIVIE